MQQSSNNFFAKSEPSGTGGTMRMACRKTAITIVALMLGAALGCASSGHKSAPPPVSDTATPEAPAKTAATSPKAKAQVQEASFSEDSDGARLVLSSDAPLTYTAYEPRPDLLVVDLPGVGLSDKFAPLAPTPNSFVTSVHVEPIAEMGKQLTRVTIAHREGLRYDVRSVGQGLAIALDSGSPIMVAEETAASPEPAPVAPAPSPSPAPATRTANLTPPPVVIKSPARGEIAHQLEEIRVASAADSVTISLLGDGVFAPKDFVLENPARVVVDLPGVHNGVKRRVVPVKSDLVTRVRVSQFQAAPDEVTRVVLDLSRPLPHTVRPDGERVAVVVGTSLPAASAIAMGSTPASHTTLTADASRISETNAPASSAAVAGSRPATPPPSESPVSETAAPQTGGEAQA